MPLSHRAATTDDLHRVARFALSPQELFYWFPKASWPLTAEQLIAAAATRTGSTVVELDGRIVAHANFLRWTQGGDCAIGQVVVEPTTRGQGVGRYLIETMCTAAFTRYAARSVSVACFSGNTAGLLFYPPLGFVPQAIEARRDLHGAPTALIHLRRLRAD